MHEKYWDLLGIVAPVFIIIGTGYVIRLAGWLSSEADVSLMRVIVNLLYPCLILDTILGNKALEQPGNILLAPAVGFGTVILGYAACWFAAPAFGLTDVRQRRTFAFTAGLYNYGYIALPLVQKLFDQQTTGVLFVHNLGVEIALWTAGLMLVSGASPRHGWMNVFNAPVIAILTAVALHFAGASNWMPGIFLTAIHIMGAAAIPLGLILTGATFADQMRNLNAKNNVSLSVASCLMRLGVLPAIMLFLAWVLPCPVELRRVILIQAAMPCAVIPVILSKHYGGDASTSMRIVLVTSVFGLITIPWWIHLGMRLVRGVAPATHLQTLLPTLERICVTFGNAKV